MLNVKENDALLMMKDLCQDAHGEVIHSCKSIINPQYYDLTFVSSVERMKWEKYDNNPKITAFCDEYPV